MWVTLWSLLLGCVPIQIEDRSPPLLFFDVLLILWMAWRFLFSASPFPELSDRRVLYLSGAYLTPCTFATVLNGLDIPKSPMSMKIFAFGILVYISAPSSRLRLWFSRVWLFGGACALP
jgi:hypothetical protein